MMMLILTSQYNTIGLSVTEFKQSEQFKMHFGIRDRQYSGITLSDSGIKYALTPEPFRRMSIEQEDVVSSLFLLPGDYTVEQKQRFLQYMLHYLAALQENKVEVHV
ncbi:unnamed protein product [Gongylonema pulchrum]|uniref:Transcriptional regulator n=1 Tax=Gongylonema pulchrum TaxID=637853 RepID=A0A183EDR5_9BILA|nr:unnamed protein product [Gongylonema pulchrum]